jgi:hypothetical protein
MGKADCDFFFMVLSVSESIGLNGKNIVIMNWKEAAFSKDLF